MTKLLALACSLALLAPAPAQRVWNVAPSPGPGVDFTVIQDAVNAAADGDFVLVRDGTYAAFRVDDKALTVIGDAAGRVILDPTATGAGLAIENLAAGRSVVVRNFTLVSSSAQPLLVRSCQGPVTLEDCAFSALFTLAQNPAAVVVDAPRVTLIRCSMRGGQARGPSPGLVAINAGLFLHGTVARGGSSPTAILFAGAPAADLFATAMVAVGSNLQGGSGAPGALIGTACQPAQDGGDALRLDGASVARLRSTLLTPGPAGTAPAGCPPAQPGQTVAGAGTVYQLAGPLATFYAPAVAHAGQTATLRLTGAPGYGAWLVLAPSPSPQLFLPCAGSLHPDLAAAVVVFAGTVPSTGALNVDVPLPAVLGVGGVIVHGQVILTNPGSCLAGTGGTLVVVP